METDTFEDNIESAEKIFRQVSTKVGHEGEKLEL